MECSWNHEYLGLVQEIRSIHNFMSRPKIEFITNIYILLIHNYYIEIIHNLGNKIVLYLMFSRINGFVGVLNEKAEQPL